MIIIYQIFLQIIWILKPIWKLLPHKKVSYFFRHQGSIRLSQKLNSPPIWIHASSGEIEYAKPLIRELQNRYPSIPIMVTHTSLSSEKAVAQLGVQAWGIAPLDTPQDVKSFLAKWNPKACLIARTDLWPQTLIELHRAKIPTFLFSATFSVGCKKIGFMSRVLLQSCLPLLTKIFFVSQDDEKLCHDFFPDISGEVLGDTRYDQVLYRLKQSQVLNIPTFNKTLILGSTWSEDEAAVIPALKKLKEAGWKFILVPHEVDFSHVQKIKNQLATQSLSFHLFSHPHFTWENTDVLLVDKVGLLASLYSKCQLAFVGGSFRKQVHSVMEALAAGCPAIVGPYFLNNREAIEFKTLGFVRDVHTEGQFISAAQDFFEDLHRLKPSLSNEIMSRTGATNRLIQSLEAQGLFAKN